MTQFSKQDSQERLSGPGGAVAIALQQDFQRSKTRNGLANSASFFLKRAVECILVDLDGAADELLNKAKHWLQVAIEVSEMPERYVPNRTEQRRHADLALCHWLLYNRHDRENLEHAVLHLERYVGSVPAPSLEGRLVLAFQIFLEAGEYSRIVKLCEQHHVFPIPTDLVSCDIGHSTGVMCRMLAQHRLGLACPEEFVTAAVNSFLPAAIESMCDNLQFDLIARWMKLIYWRGELSPPSAKEALLQSRVYLES